MARAGAVRRVRRRNPARGRGWIALAVVVVAAGAVLVSLWPRKSSSAISILTTPDFHSLVFHPTDPDVVFFGHHDGIMRSPDGGRIWTDVVAQRNFDAMSLASPVAAPGRLYLAGHLILQRSDDGGRTWRPIGHDLPGSDIHAMAVSPGDPERLYAFVVGWGLFGSDDGGRYWQLLAQNLPQDITSLAVAGSRADTLYAGSMRSGMLMSRDGAKTWEAVPGLRGEVLSMAGDPGRDSVYAGRTDGLYRITEGRSWTKLDYPGLNVVAIAVSPSRPGLVLAVSADEGRGLVYRSEDGGATWTPSAR